MHIRPIGDRIAVREIKPATCSDSGIYLGPAPEDTELVKHTVRGQVLAVGPGKDAGGMWGIQAGQEVEYSPVGSTTLDVDGQAVTMIRRDAVVGVHP